jgi:hypothetical protein
MRRVGRGGASRPTRSRENAMTITDVEDTT